MLFLKNKYVVLQKIKMHQRYLNFKKIIKNYFLFLSFIIFSFCTNQPNSTVLKGDFKNGGLFLPNGFEALVVADSVGLARHLAVNANNDIYVKLRITTGKNGSVALRDTNHDGKADIIQRFGEYPNDGSFATEMKIHNGYLYFSTEQVVYRQKLNPEELIPDADIEVLVIDHHPLQWHNAKALAFDGKGNMYVTFSAPTNACEDGFSVPEKTTSYVKGYNPCPQLNGQAGIWKFKEDQLEQFTSNGEQYASGVRSVVGMTWNNQTNSLYAVIHARDYLYQHAPQFYTPWQNAVVPAEEFVKIEKGSNYGWPYTYYDYFKQKRMLAPEYGGDGVKEATGYAEPILGLPAHFAPNDVLFYTGDMFPQRYQNGAFIAFHGSTNRSPYPQAGYFVAFVPFKDGKPFGTWEVFADGFAGIDTIIDMPDAAYRPVGLAQGPDGSLYICESKKGKIWRIFYNKQKSDFAESDLENMNQRKLLSHIKTPDSILDNINAFGNINGETIYKTNCSNCHQDDGRGIEGLYPSLIKNDWTSGQTKKLISIIKNGSSAHLTINKQTYSAIMPSFYFLSTHEIAALVNFIHEKYGGNKARVESKDVENILKRKKK